MVDGKMRCGRSHIIERKHTNAIAFLQADRFEAGA
jgi:hypothetical protein